MKHDGTFEIEVVLPAGADSAAERTALSVVDAFLDAIELGMFPPGAVAERRQGTSATMILVTLRGIPEHAFRVLNGMLAYHNAVVQPLVSWHARLGSRDLCGTSESLPEIPDPVPVPGIFEIGSTLTPPLNVRIELARRPDEPVVEELSRHLQVWHKLLQGGYPPPDSPPGESGTTPPSIRLDDPVTLLYSVDMWRTGLEAFVPLYNLVQGWTATGLAVMTVDITS